MLVFDHLGTKTLIAVMEYIYLTIPMLATENKFSTV